MAILEEDDATTLEAFVARRSYAASLRATREWERRSWWRAFRGHLRSANRALEMVGRSVADAVRGDPVGWCVGVGYAALMVGMAVGGAAERARSGGDNA
jgi:hypothetical protein